MTISCESFMDYSYDDIAIEMVNPFKEFLNIIERIASVIQRLINNLRKLRKITIPKKYLELFNKIIPKYESGFSTVNKYLRGRQAENLSDEEAEKGAEELNRLVDWIESTGFYNIFMTGEAKEPNLPGSEYVEMPSNEFIKFMNNDIKVMAQTRTVAKTTLVKISPNVRKFLNAYVRFINSRLKLYYKVLAFKKVSKEESGTKINLTNKMFVNYSGEAYAAEGFIDSIKSRLQKICYSLYKKAMGVYERNKTKHPKIASLFKSFADFFKRHAGNVGKAQTEDQIKKENEDIKKEAEKMKEAEQNISKEDPDKKFVGDKEAVAAIKRLRGEVSSGKSNRSPADRAKDMETVQKFLESENGKANAGLDKLRKELKITDDEMKKMLGVKGDAVSYIANRHNALLKKLDGISNKPYDGDFDEFMKDKSKRLVYK